ncbi:MAG: hypothetical protein ABI779_05700 [Acidobacteriota bacterium]
MKVTGSIIALMLLVRVPVNAQTNVALAPERAFRDAATVALTTAARQAKVPLARLPIAYAGGEGGFVLNAAVEGAEKTDARSLAAGSDLLFMYMGGKGFAIPEGFYRVSVIGKEARFTSSAGRVVATLPARIDDTAGPAARPKVKVKVTASWGKNGPEVDIEIIFGETAATARAIMIDIPARPVVTIANLPMQAGNEKTPCPPLGRALTRADAATTPYLREILPNLDQQCALRGAGLKAATVTFLSCEKDARGVGFGPNAKATLTCE